MQYQRLNLDVFNVPNNRSSCVIYCMKLTLAIWSCRASARSALGGYRELLMARQLCCAAYSFSFLLCRILMAGILPFGAMFIELFFIFSVSIEPTSFLNRIPLVPKPVCL